MPCSFVHVLLSLLLVITQQLSLLHVATHWQEARTPHGLRAAEQLVGDSQGKPAKPALHDLCSQCLDAAQLAFALPAPDHVFIPLAVAYGSPARERRDGIVPQKLHDTQPRGPPRA